MSGQAVEAVAPESPCYALVNGPLPEANIGFRAVYLDKSRVCLRLSRSACQADVIGECGAWIDRLINQLLEGLALAEVG